MTTTTSDRAAIAPGDILLDAAAPSAAAALPVWMVREGEPPAPTGLGDAALAWLAATRFTPAAKKQALLPAADGNLAAVVVGGGTGSQGEPCGPSDLIAGQLAQTLPGGAYRLAGGFADPRLAALAWGLGAYRFRRYKTQPAADAPACLVVPEGLDRAALVNEVEAVWLGRDLVNTPASDLGPAAIEAAARALAARHGAEVRSIVGDDLLAKGFPMIHAVGRAALATRPPRLVEITWGRPGARQVTLVGKGITFDTGGLDIKPSSGMLLMKKDMGGAAVALALAHMIMGQRLDVRLRVLIASAENSISGDAFRPSDVLTTRDGRTVEIGNTDAEGRLVLADALTLADEAEPDTVLVFATLTGAARVALGPDLPAMFTNDDGLAQSVAAAGLAVGDPVWRLPLWPGYERHLDSEVADMNNVYEAPFAGAITAALFLKRFSKRARRFAHFDLYGWRPAQRVLGPKGGEAQCARAVFEALKRECER